MVTNINWATIFLNLLNPPHESVSNQPVHRNVSHVSHYLANVLGGIALLKKFRST